MTLAIIDLLRYEPHIVSVIGQEKDGSVRPWISLWC